MKVRTRIAPSPTGIAHLGTAYTALRNWAIAKQNNGQFILRVEDTDRERYVEGAIEVVLEALKWLGLDNDEGPNVGGPHAPYIQSERLEIYQKYAKELIDKDQAYYCFCSKERLDKVRKDLQKRRKLPQYDKHCRNLSASEVQSKIDNGKTFVIRLKVPESGTTVCNDLIRGKVEFENSGIDDQVLLKSDGFPTYHLGVVVDDHLMDITHIIRGEEWLSSTPKHVLLYHSFGWDLPKFAHLPIIRNKDKSKMSKRKNDVSILSYRDKGYLPEAINNFLALMGWSHPEKKEVFSLEEFCEVFTIERTQTTAPAFDIDKLNWLNGVHIRKLDHQEILSRLEPFIPAECSPELAKKILPLIRERLVTLADFEQLTNFFYQDIKYDRSLLEKKGADKELVDKQLEATNKALSGMKQWSHEAIEEQVRTLAKNNLWKPSQYFMMLRIASTGKKATPPLFETLEVLGRNKVLKRFSIV